MDTGPDDGSMTGEPIEDIPMGTTDLEVEEPVELVDARVDEALDGVPHLGRELAREAGGLPEAVEDRFHEPEAGLGELDVETG